MKKSLFTLRGKANMANFMIREQETRSSKNNSWRVVALILGAIASFWAILKGICELLDISMNAVGEWLIVGNAKEMQTFIYDVYINDKVILYFLCFETALILLFMGIICFSVISSLRKIFLIYFSLLWFAILNISSTIITNGFKYSNLFFHYIIIILFSILAIHYLKNKSPLLLTVPSIGIVILCLFDILVFSISDISISLYLQQVIMISLLVVINILITILTIIFFYFYDRIPVPNNKTASSPITYGDVLQDRVDHTSSPYKEILNLDNFEENHLSVLNDEADRNRKK